MSLTPLYHSKSQNKNDINNVELSLTNSIENSDFILLKNGTIKQKRKKNSYFEEFIDNKRLNKAIENSNKKRVKSYNSIRNKNNLFYKTDYNGIKSLKHSTKSDNNIFGKAQKINIYENVIINNLNNDNLKLSYSFNNNSKNEENKICNCNKYNNKEKCKYNQMMDIKRKKLDKYENLINTKNMYKDLYKNLKKKNMKKIIKNKSNNLEKMENVQNKFININKQEENSNQKIKYEGNNLKIIKNDIIQYNSYTGKNKIKNKSEIKNKTDKNIIKNLNNLIIFKKQKEYKHFDCLGNNYNYYERNESSERKSVNNEKNNEFTNIINKIKNEENKSNIRNTYDIKYGYTPEYNFINNKEYGNHNVYVSNNVKYENKLNRSSKNYKLTSINMNKVNENFKNIENITNSIKNNNHVTFKNNNFNNTKTYISKTNKKINNEKEDEKMKKNKSYKNIIENKLNNVSHNYFNKRNYNNEKSLLNNKLRKNKSYSINNKYNLINKSLSNKGNLITPKKNEEKKYNNLKKYETKIIKTNFDYSNKLDENINYNNLNKKEIKYYNTDKNFNKKISNYNYYNSNNNKINYNLRDKYKEELRLRTEQKYNNHINIGTNINKKEETKDNNTIFELKYESKGLNKVSDYHCPGVNHNFYECKNVNPNKWKIKQNNRNNNNQLINSIYKEINNKKIKTIIENDKIKENLNEKFKNINKINDLLNQKNKPIIQYKNTDNNQNLIKTANTLDNFKTIPTNKIFGFNNNNLSLQRKEKAKNEKIDNMKKILKMKKRRFHSYSPNKIINVEYYLYKKVKSFDMDNNKKFNYSQSEKMINKIKKEKNDLIKKFNIKKYLTEKNLIKPFNNSNNKKLNIRNKSHDSIMPPNDMDEIFRKNNKLFKLLNKD